MYKLFIISPITRSSLLLRREVDDKYQTLSQHRRFVGGSSPFITMTSPATTTASTTTRSTTSTATPPARSGYEEWYYKDLTNAVHGPFDSEVMFEWDLAGYFRSATFSLRLFKTECSVFTSLPCNQLFIINVCKLQIRLASQT